MPHLEDKDADGNEIFLSETDAVLHYFAEKAGRKDMIATTAQEIMTASIIRDIYKTIGDGAYYLPSQEDYKKKAEAAIQKMEPYQIKGLAARLEGKKWLYGDNLKVQDF